MNKDKEQAKYIQRKPTQLQLEELTNKGKKKVQTVTAPVPEAGTMAAVSPGGLQPPPVQQAQVQPTPPVVNVYAQQPQQWNNDNRQQRLPKIIREEETGARRDHLGSVGDANSQDTLEEIVLLTPGNNSETGTKIIGNRPEEAGNKIRRNHRAM